MKPPLPFATLLCFLLTACHRPNEKDRTALSGSCQLADEISGYKQSRLSVRLQGSIGSKVNIVLFIPSVCVMAEGCLLKDGKTCGFYETNGNIVLPQGATAYIPAMSEEMDRGQLYP